MSHSHSSIYIQHISLILSFCRPRRQLSVSNSLLLRYLHPHTLSFHLSHPPSHTQPLTHTHTHTHSLSLSRCPGQDVKATSGVRMTRRIGGPYSPTAEVPLRLRTLHCESRVRWWVHLLVGGMAPAGVRLAYALEHDIGIAGGTTPSGPVCPVLLSLAPGRAGGEVSAVCCGAPRAREGSPQIPCHASGPLPREE